MGKSDKVVKELPDNWDDLTTEQKMIYRLQDTIGHLDPHWNDGEMPDKEGWYWAYGYPFKEEIDRITKMMKGPETFIIQVIRVGHGDSGSLAYVRNGNFWEEEDRGHCVFKRIPQPLGPKYFDHAKAAAMDKDPRLGKYMGEDNADS